MQTLVKYRDFNTGAAYAEQTDGFVPREGDFVKLPDRYVACGYNLFVVSEVCVSAVLDYTTEDGVTILKPTVNIIEVYVKLGTPKYKGR
jgi:hypothetical protein